MSILEFIVEMRWVLFFSTLVVWGTIATKRTVKKAVSNSDKFAEKIADAIVDKEPK